MLFNLNLFYMKKIALLLAFFAIGLQVLMAQTRDISGKVTSADDGGVIPGVSVSVKGTTLGTVTDMDGIFRLKIPQDSKTLVFSFVGMKTQEVAVGSQNTYNVKLASESIAVDEVVVTALGITREKKALGYAVQDVDGEEMLKARGGNSNPMNSLAGKIAGLQITGGSGNIGGSSKILIRGVKSLSGNNQPLFVIDGVPIEGSDYNTADAARGAGGFDYGNLVQDINPDDIESISVLKGPNASALYGSRATNGVVMITTKKGTKGKGLGITVNSSIGFEKVNKLPKMQKQYGGGYSLTETDINGQNYLVPDYGIDESWGPEYDGTQYLSWYDVAKWEAAGKVGNPTTSAWVSPKNDIDSFFELGTSLTNNITLSQANENASLRISYTNSQLDGYMPNSSLDKNIVNLSGTIKGDKLYELTTNLTYLNQAAKGRPETGYGDNNVMQKFIQWGQRQLDMKELKSLYRFPDGSQAAWNRAGWDDPKPEYSNNPYWSRYMNYQNDTRDRIYGNIGIKLNLMENLKFQYKLNLDYFSDKQYERNAVGSQEQSRFYEAQRQQHEVNHEFLFIFSEKFNNFSLNANVGGNLMYQRYQRIDGESVGGLVLPEFYNLDNSKSPALATNYTREKAINSVFASTSLGYKSYAYLDLTLRNDWSSALPKGNNSYMYPSVTGSFIFSEVAKLPWLSLGKLRLGWAKVGNDTDPYRIIDTYTFYTSFGGEHSYVKPTTMNNTNLKPEETTSYEAGLELSFFKNRLGLDVTAYYGETKNQILPLSLSGTTGYVAQIINAGLLSNQGIELTLKGTPVKTSNFEWDITGTLSSNKNKVKELLDGVDYYRLTSAPFKVEIGAYKGQEYGSIMGTDFVYNDKGEKIVSGGKYTSTSGNVPLGSVYPKALIGISNTFRYKNIDFSFLFDGQFGGKFFSTSYMWGMYSGMLEETAGLNELGNKKRNDPAEGGGVLVKGVNADGTPNTTRLDAESWGAEFYNGPATQNVFKSDFVKLREVTIGYNVPLKSSSFVKNLKVSAYGRNLLLFGPDTKHFDPEMATTSSGNIQGIEGGALPSIATFGLNIGLQF
jgi:TonB-linked SusC/RagA family outer membrane protein